MMWTPDNTPLTVGDLRKAMEGLPDDAQVFVEGGSSTDGVDRPIVGAEQTQQIAHHAVATWQPGYPTVIGLELWLGDDDEFPAPRCQHSTRPTPKED